MCHENYVVHEKLLRDGFAVCVAAKVSFGSFGPQKGSQNLSPLLSTVVIA